MVFDCGLDPVELDLRPPGRLLVALTGNEAELRTMETVAKVGTLIGCLLALGLAIAPGGQGQADMAETGRDQRAAAPIDSLPLNLTAFAATPARRLLLKYLVSCALPEGVLLYADVDGHRHRFAGSLGLAPGWIERGLTPSEQRWVSACILARTNYFGREVAISMRAPAPAPAALQSSPEERTNFSLFEGGFYGNIFQDEPRAFACSAERTPKQAADRSYQDRVCSEPSGSTLPSGESLTRCGFVHAGTCPAPENFTPGPDGYREVIFTYLRPAGPQRH